SIKGLFKDYLNSLNKKYSLSKVSIIQGQLLTFAKNTHFDATADKKSHHYPS
ncbi:MAG: hypothetical protein ACI9XO_003373, partial [Paraglaciecola sp.]